MRLNFITSAKNYRFWYVSYSKTMHFNSIGIDLILKKDRDRSISFLSHFNGAVCKKLKLNVDMSAITGPFFKFRKHPFKGCSYRWAPTIKILILTRYSGPYVKWLRCAISNSIHSNNNWRSSAKIMQISYFETVPNSINCSTILLDKNKIFNF